MSEQNLNRPERRVRLVIAKEGRSVFISHLDLMRTLIRALIRADLLLKHSEGFHQRAYLSLVRPLSLGYESDGEYCDVVLMSDFDLDTLPARLTAVLPEGITVRDAYEDAANGREIMWTSYDLQLELAGDRDAWADKLQTLWRDPELTVMKRNKRGVYQPANVAESVRSIDIRVTESGLAIHAVLRDSPDGSLNPSYLLMAAEEKLSFKPDFVRTRRTGFYGENGEPIR